MSSKKGAKTTTRMTAPARIIINDNNQKAYGATFLRETAWTWLCGMRRK